MEDERARRASRLDASDGDASRRRIDAVAARIDARRERRRWSTAGSDAGSDARSTTDGDGGRPSTRAVCSSSAREAREWGGGRARRGRARREGERTVEGEGEMRRARVGGKGARGGWERWARGDARAGTRTAGERASDARATR